MAIPGEEEDQTGPRSTGWEITLQLLLLQTNKIERRANGTVRDGAPSRRNLATCYL